MPYDVPEEPAVEELDVVEEQVIDHQIPDAIDQSKDTDQTENNGQITMF